MIGPHFSLKNCADFFLCALYAYDKVSTLRFKAEISGPDLSVLRSRAEHPQVESLASSGSNLSPQVQS